MESPFLEQIFWGNRFVEILSAIVSFSRFINLKDWLCRFGGELFKIKLDPKEDISSLLQANHILLLFRFKSALLKYSPHIRLPCVGRARDEK